MIDKIANFASHCIPLLKEQFHKESSIMQWALHSFDEVSPNYLGGKKMEFPCLLMYHTTLQIPVTMILWILDYPS